MSQTTLEGEVITRKVGRPPKLTPEERQEVYEAFEKFIERTPDPTIAGFLSWDPVPIGYHVTRDNLNDWSEFSTLITFAVRKQEAFLLQAAGQGRYNATLAIFRLKQPQHGYKDRVDTDITSDGKSLAPVLVKFIDDKQADARNTDTE